MVDPIADLMTRIRNAGLARHAVTRVPYSRIKVRMVEIMRDEGYLEGFSVDEADGIHKEIVVELRYVDGNQVAFHRIRRVSSPGRRVYTTAKDIQKVKAGLGVAIISTSSGLMTDRDARRRNVGGEVLCEIW